MFLRSASPDLRGNEKKYLIDAIDEEEISSQGRFVREFESSFADFCDARHAVSTSNGTTALHLALLAAGIKEGDEVIVPAPYWVSYPDVVLFAGGTPVFVAAGPEQGYKLRPEQLEAAITPRTKWVILNSPSNPTGATLSAEELKSLAETCSSKGVKFINYYPVCISKVFAFSYSWFIYIR